MKKNILKFGLNKTISIYSLIALSVMPISALAESDFSMDFDIENNAIELTGINNSSIALNLGSSIGNIAFDSFSSVEVTGDGTNNVFVSTIDNSILLNNINTLTLLDDIIFSGIETEDGTLAAIIIEGGNTTICGNVSIYAEDADAQVAAIATSGSQTSVELSNGTSVSASTSTGIGSAITSTGSLNLSIEEGGSATINGNINTNSSDLNISGGDLLVESGTIFTGDADITIDGSILTLNNSTVESNQVIVTSGSSLLINDSTINSDINIGTSYDTQTAIVQVTGGVINGTITLAENALANLDVSGDTSLTVNGSMQDYTGLLTISSTMILNNTLGANSITINDEGVLLATIIDNNTFTNSSLSIINNGSLQLIAAPTLISGQSYNISTAGLDFDSDGGLSAIAYGGNIINNSFIVSSANKITIDENNSIQVQSNGRVEASNGDVDKKIVMSFNSENQITINSITDISDDADFLNIVSTQLTQVAEISEAYSFNIESNEVDTALISFLIIGDYDLSDFKVFNINEDGCWEVASDITYLTYDGQYLSFITNNFTEYGYAAVPEPSTYAIIFGGIALGFAMYRRRK